MEMDPLPRKKKKSLAEASSGIWIGRTLLLALFLSAQHASAESDRAWRQCSAFMQDLAADFHDSTAMHKESFETKWRNELATSPPGAPDAISWPNLAASLRKHSELARSEKVNVTDISYALDGMPATKADLRFCNDKRAFKKYIKRFEEQYRSDSDALLESFQALKDLFPLAADEGVLIAAGYVEGSVGSVELDRKGNLGGTVRLGPFRDEEFFQLLKVRSGTYRWERMEVGYGRYFDFSDAGLSITIKPGVLNYGGVLSLTLESDIGMAMIDDRAAVIIDKMEARFPDFLAAMTLANALDPADPFLSFYLDEQAQRRNAPDSAP